MQCMQRWSRRIFTNGTVQIAPAGLSIAFSATLAPARDLIYTAPTTPAGLRALENYLLEDGMGPRMVRQRIESPRTVDGITFTAGEGSPEAVDWFIARRAADLNRG